ncbi:MAG TPA: thiol peroxidase [Nitrospiraceae bacterium]|nr:thiol peroxidase [Nitrospiraceae bacterium]
MRGVFRTIIGSALCMTIGLAGCGSMGGSTGSSFQYKNMTVADGSVIPGEGQKVLFKGSPLVLSGTAIKVGDSLREVQLTQTDLSPIGITDTKGKGKVRIISVVPSLDTPVCEQQTHYLSEKNKGLDKMVELVTVSVDTPFAQKRFAQEAQIANVTFLSDYRDAEFGKTYGLFLKGPHILARTVMVVDANNTVRYLQVTPELTQLPDLDEAFKVAKSLITAS